MTRSAALVVASSLDAEQNAVLAAHAGVAEVIPLPERPWEVGPGVDALFTHQAQWSDPTMPAGWPFDLRWFQTTSAGVERLPQWVFDVPLVTRGIGVQAPAIAEYVMAAIYAVEKRFNLPPLAGPDDWQQQALGTVAGATVGIAGLGSIGRAVADLALANGMRIAALARHPKPALPGIEMVDTMAELIATSDHFVLALPLTAATRGIIDADTLAHARRGLHIVNVARGALIDDAALIEAMQRGQVGAATLDTTHPEPLPAGHPFYSMPGVRLTPHTSGVTPQSRQALHRQLTDNIDRFLVAGDVPGIVNRDAGY